MRVCVCVRLCARVGRSQSELVCVCARTYVCVHVFVRAGYCSFCYIRACISFLCLRIICLFVVLLFSSFFLFCFVCVSADIEVTVGSLMQIDKLVQLIESPIFIRNEISKQ